LNAKTVKKIFRQTEKISVEWLKSLLSEEEAAKVTPENYKNYMKMTTHYFRDRQIFMSAFTERWTRQRLKKLYKKNPQRPIDTYSFSDLK